MNIKFDTEKAYRDWGRDGYACPRILWDEVTALVRAFSQKAYIEEMRRLAIETYYFSKATSAARIKLAILIRYAELLDINLQVSITGNSYEEKVDSFIEAVL